MATKLPGPLSKKARIYKPRIVRAKRRSVRCWGGPLHGMYISLTGDLKTLALCVRGQAGIYDEGRWKEIGGAA